MTFPDWSIHGLGESPAGKGTGGNSNVFAGGRILRRGDSVMISRRGWEGRIGKYLSFDRKRNLLKVRFVEEGGALLLCNKSEILRLDFSS